MAETGNMKSRHFTCDAIGRQNILHACDLFPWDISQRLGDHPRNAGKSKVPTQKGFDRNLARSVEDGWSVPSL